MRALKSSVGLTIVLAAMLLLAAPQAGADSIKNAVDTNDGTVTAHTKLYWNVQSCGVHNYYQMTQATAWWTTTNPSIRVLRNAIGKIGVIAGATCNNLGKTQHIDVTYSSCGIRWDTHDACAFFDGTKTSTPHNDTYLGSDWPYVRSTDLGAMGFWTNVTVKNNNGAVFGPDPLCASSYVFPAGGYC